MGQRLAVLSTCAVAMAASAWPVAAQAVRSPAAKTALEAFNARLQKRSTPISRVSGRRLDAGSRAQVLASLAEEEELRPSRGELEKIAAAERILDYSARKGTVTVKVIDLDYAFTGLYDRTVLLVSRQQLAILDADEFAAFAAHELGHDYDWDVTGQR